jgi:hypothetical protein
MRWNMAAAIAVLASAAITGCLTEAAVVEKFVCADAFVVDSPEDCGGHNNPCPKCQKPECPACSNLSCPKTEYPTDTTVAAQSQAAPEGGCERLGCPAGTEYVSSKTSKKYHTCDCRFATVLSAKNLVCYGSAREAEAAGKEPCGICSG